MKVGQGNAHFIADLHKGIPDEVMRERWRAGEYDTPDGNKPRPSYALAWRAMAGRKTGGMA
jgi:hypothetical protein